MLSSMTKFTLKRTIGDKTGVKITDYLAAETGLSKGRIKDAMNKGAVWIGREKGALRRLRKATAMLQAGTRLEFYYDEALLAIAPPRAQCLEDRTEYSVWVKPAGLVAQGTMYGDHCSLLRQAEIYFEGKREVFPVHRLDREAAGLMLVAHTRKAAALLSEIFRKNLIVKKYRVEVLGNLSEKGRKGAIRLQLDGKEAHTEYEVESYDPAASTSQVDVTIKTGRLHQIRRHFDLIGHPVMGDPKYGKGNKNNEGMKLIAYSLKFKCPIKNKEVEYKI